MGKLPSESEYLENLGSDLAAMDAAAKPESSAQPVIGKRASAIEPRPINWLWPGHIARGTLTVIDGDPGCGKSTLTRDLATRVSSGRTFPDGEPCGQATAIIFSAEDDPAATIRPGLEAAGANLDRVVVASLTLESDDGPRLLTLPDDIPLIESTLREIGATLVVLDPLSAFLSGKVDSHRDQDIRRVLAALAAMAERTNVALVVVRHLNKSGGSNPMYRGGGSIGITAAARAAFLVGIDPHDPEPEKRRIFAPVKNNLAPMPKSLAFRLVQSGGDAVAHVEWIEGSADVSARDLLRDPETERHGSIEDAKDFLREILADGPRATAEVKRSAQIRGLSGRTLDRARAEVGVESFKAKGEFAGVWYLKLPDADGASKSATDLELQKHGQVWRRSSEPSPEKDSNEVRQPHNGSLASGTQTTSDNQMTAAEDDEIDRHARNDGWRSEESSGE